MSSFLPVILFIMPGVIVLYFIKLFGLNIPAINGSAETIISLLLWIPVNLFVLGIYTLMIFIINDVNSTTLPYINDLSSLKNATNSLGFILFYITCSTVGSYLLAKIISGKVYNYFLKKVNNIRIRNNKAPLSREASVWDRAFTNNTADIVRISNINDNESQVIGEIKNISSIPFKEKDLLLRYVKVWTDILTQNNDVEIDEIYYDTKTGCKIEIYNRDQCQKLYNNYNKD